MKNKPLVSVIMPVYNGEKFLKYSIESILNQTYRNFEFIIIDDGSTDNSLKIIKEYQKKDKRIKVIENKKNLGIAFSYNQAINLAKGDLIACMEADDISNKNRFYFQVSEFIREKDLIIVGSNIEIINEKNKTIGLRLYPYSHKKIIKSIIFKSPFAQPSVMFKKKIYFISKGYNEQYKNAMDYDLWFRILKLGKGKNIQKYLLKYRIHKNQSKSKKLKNQLKETINIQKKYLFKKDYFSILSLLNYLLLNFIYFLPNFLIFWLFKKIEFKKSK